MQYPSCHHPAIPFYTQLGHPSIPLSAPGWSTVHFCATELLLLLKFFLKGGFD